MVLPAPPLPRWLRFGLIAIAALETLAAVLFFPAIFYSYEQPTALIAVSQWLGKLRLALSPLVAGTALYFSIRGDVRRAILALGALALLAWLSGLPNIAIHGPEIFSTGTPAWQVAMQKFVNPFAAALAILFAVQNRRLAAAAMLVSVPTLVALTSFVAFSLGVGLLGF